MQNESIKLTIIEYSFYETHEEAHTKIVQHMRKMYKYKYNIQRICAIFVCAFTWLSCINRMCNTSYFKMARKGLRFIEKFICEIYSFEKITNIKSEKFQRFCTRYKAKNKEEPYLNSLKVVTRLVCPGVMLNYTNTF